jgi:uncharacterized C2H2 Zn-finger protein
LRSSVDSSGKTGGRFLPVVTFPELTLRYRANSDAASEFRNQRLPDCPFPREGSIVVIDDKVKLRCPGCKRMFREKAKRIRDGAQFNCPDCSKLITISKETEDSVMRRAIKTAREIRSAQEAELVKAVYTGAASAAARDTP